MVPVSKFLFGAIGYGRVYAVGTIPVGSLLGLGSNSLEAGRLVDSPSGGRLEIDERIGPQADIRKRIQLIQLGS